VSFRRWSEVLTGQSILDAFSDKNSEQMLSLLRGLTELALSAPKAIEAKAEEIHRIIMQDIVYKKSTSSEVGLPAAMCD
jgi:hypothetical protein